MGSGQELRCDFCCLPVPIVMVVSEYTPDGYINLSICAECEESWVRSGNRGKKKVRDSHRRPHYVV